MNLSLQQSLGLRQEISLRQELTLKQKLALELALKLKITVKQLLKLFPNLAVLDVQNYVNYCRQEERRDERGLERLVDEHRRVQDFLSRNPTAYEFKRQFAWAREMFEDAERIRYQRVQEQRRREESRMKLSLELRPAITLTQSMYSSLPGWSFVEAYDTGKKTSDFPKKRISGFKDHSLVERLKMIDKENEVFRFRYINAEEAKELGLPSGCYRVPLLRDRNIAIEDIAERIQEREYKSAKRKRDGVSGLDRIARAVPYTGLHFAVKEFVEQNGATLDDVVLVGIDRGGRVPTLIMKHALGKHIAYFVKVDQGSTQLDYQALKRLMGEGVLRDKFVVFVDSTVDSGRQIEALKHAMNQAQSSGCKGWGVVGSNENGLDLPYHKNTDWGLDPDKSFEDDPRLMGVDYAEGSHVRVRAVPSKTASTIRAAIMEVPKGIVFDFSTKMKKEEQAGSLERKIERTVHSRVWEKIVNNAIPAEEVALEQLGNESGKKVSVVVSGSSNGMNRFHVSYLEGVGRSLAPFVEVLYVGTEKGAPGAVMRGVASGVDEVVVLRPTSEQERMQTIRANAGVSNVKISFAGRDKEEHHRKLAEKGEVHVVLDGGRGTLTEAMYAMNQGKPTIILSSSNVGRYVGRTQSLRARDNVRLVDDLNGVVKAVRDYGIK